MLTYSGRRITPTNQEVPRMKDVAIHLGRIVRFAGATQTWWTVLHHSLAAGQLADWLFESNPIIRTFALLHDAHEAITSDIPTTWKAESTNVLQHGLDQRIYRELGLFIPGSPIIRRIKLIDKALLVAEALLIGPPKINPNSPIWQWPTPESVGLNATTISTSYLSKLAKDAVHNIQEKYPLPEDTIYLNSKAPLEYMKAVRNALKKTRERLKHEHIRNYFNV